MLKLVITAACLCATMAQAQASDMSGREISGLVAGATVEIDTPIGAKLRARYATDGKLAGEAPGLAWYLGGVADEGRWWVTSDRLCHKWSRWLNSEPQCMRLAKVGRTIQWRSLDGYSGTATIAMPPPVQAAAAPPPRPAVAPPAPPPPAGAAASAEEPAKVLGDALPPPPAATGETVAPAPAAPDKSPPPPKAAARPSFKVANLRNDDVLNVRSGPSADFDIVGGLRPGSRGIAITSLCRASWCPVRHEAVAGWVNSAYLAPDEPLVRVPRASPSDGPAETVKAPALHDAPDAPRSCLTAATRALLDRIEQSFGPVQVVSTCRHGALIPGTMHPSRHASGNAVDFHAGSRKAAIVEWLIANHRRGGTMTYAAMDHIHVDIGPHFVSIANGPQWYSWK